MHAFCRVYEAKVGTYDGIQSPLYEPILLNMNLFVLKRKGNLGSPRCNHATATSNLADLTEERVLLWVRRMSGKLDDDVALHGHSLFALRLTEAHSCAFFFAAAR